MIRHGGRRMGRPMLPFLLTVLALVAGPACAQTYAPEPDGFWMGEMGGPVPATIAGGKVIGTAELRELVDAGGAVLVDVAPTPHRPEGLAESSLWLPPPRRSLPGSVWLADVGRGALEPALDAWYRDRLAALTGGDRARPVVVFCHPQCWASWNAARRAILYGYSQVYWYPDGVDGWQLADLPTEIVEPEPQPELEPELQPGQ